MTNIRPKGKQIIMTPYDKPVKKLSWTKGILHLRKHDQELYVEDLNDLIEVLYRVN